MSGGNYKESIRQSVARIVKYSKSEIDEGNILLATVERVYTDVLDLNTFGTMSVTIQPSGIVIPDIPLNAHVNNDGSTGVSGKYTFPKPKSDVFLILDIKNGVEFYYPLFYSHIDSVSEIYTSQKTTTVKQVDTPDENEPYNTTDLGVFTSETITPYSRDITSEDSSSGNSDKTIHTISTVSVNHTVSDGTDTSSVETIKGSHTITTNECFIDTNQASSFESAVLYSHLSSCVDAIVSYVDAVNAAIGTIPLTTALQQPLKDLISTPQTAMEATKIKLK